MAEPSPGRGGAVLSSEVVSSSTSFSPESVPSSSSSSIKVSSEASLLASLFSNSSFSPLSIATAFSTDSSSLCVNLTGGLMSPAVSTETPNPGTSTS